MVVAGRIAIYPKCAGELTGSIGVIKYACLCPISTAETSLRETAMANSKTTRTLAILGIVSGLLTSSSGLFLAPIGGIVKETGSTFIGIFFGIVIAVYAWKSGICRSIWRLGGFVAASTLAYAAAELGGMLHTVDPAIFNAVFGNENGPDLTICLTGGVIGGAIFFTSFLFLVAPPSAWTKSVLKLVAFSIVSGFLGMFAWGFGSLTSIALEYARITRQAGEANFWSLYVVWQAGAGIMLAYLLPSTKNVVEVADSGAAKEERVGPPGKVRQVMAGLVMLAVLAGLGFLVRREVRGYQFGVRYRARQEEAQRQAKVEMPSLENLPEIPAQKLEQLIVPQSIHGQEMEQSWANQTGFRNPHSSTTPPSVNYMTTYGTLDRDGKFRPGHVPLVTVNVTVYPNAEWAQYKLRDIPTYSMIMDPEHNLIVNKFGNRIYMYTGMRYPDGSGELSFYWPSGQRTILIRFARDEDGEFLREYLQLHPSSLLQLPRSEK